MTPPRPLTIIKPLYAGSCNTFSVSIHSGKLAYARKGGCDFVTVSPTKTTFSAGKITQIAPEAGPGRFSSRIGESPQYSVIFSTKDISGGAQRTLPKPGIASQLAPVSSPCALNVFGRFRNAWAVF